MIRCLMRVPISTWIVLALFALALVWRGWDDRRGGDPEHRDEERPNNRRPAETEAGRWAQHW